MKYFTIKELCTTNKKIKNEPDEQVKKNLEDLVDNVLDPIRERYNKPIIVNSGFRSKELNKAVGGVSTSQHCKGEAVDIKSDPELLKLIFDMIDEGLQLDQLIIERTDINSICGSWLHISFRKNNRNQILKYNGKVYSTYKRNNQ